MSRVGQRDPVRVVQVGVGAMGRTWLDALARNPDAELVGVVDLDRAAAAAAAADLGLSPTAVATRLEDLDASADAVVNVTVPAAHLPVTVAALRAGLPVLCEKPAAPTVAEAVRMAAASRAFDRLVVVSQSRRFVRGVEAMRRALADLGPVSTISCAFHRAPRFGGFRERMDHPLLVDMAIHHLDLARLLAGEAPTTVLAQSWNPTWSWFAGDAVATAVVGFTSGARFDYSGSWVARGAQSSWNGSWRISAEHGSLSWDGEGPPVVVSADGDHRHLPLGGEQEEVEGSLSDFLTRVRGGGGRVDDTRPDRADGVPASTIDDNVHSLALVEAAVQSAETNRMVSVPELVAAAHEHARATEPDPRIRLAMDDHGPALD